MAHGGKRPGAGRRKKSQPPAILDGLDPRRIKYLEALPTAKSKRQAGLDAGFSDSLARHASQKIETPAVREAFQKLIRDKIPPEKLAQRLDEGLDAQETKFFQKDGVVIESRDVVAHDIRLKAVGIAAEYGGYHDPKKVTVTGEGGGPVVFAFKRLGVREQ